MTVAQATITPDGVYALANPYQTAIFDIETNGLLDKLNRIHSLCIKIKETGQVISCTNDDPSYTSVEEGLSVLAQAGVIVGHNIIKFDIPAIQKVYPGWDYQGGVFDTLVASQLIYSDLKERDFKKRDKLKRKHGQIKMNEMWPGGIIGRHGLDAWGIRLGEWKGDYAKTRGQELKDHFHEIHMAARATGLKASECPPKTPTREQIGDYVWNTWNRPMQDYCEQDIEVTDKLLDLLTSKNYSQEALDLEHDFVQVIRLMENEGYTFNKEAAEKLEQELMIRQAAIQQELKGAFPPWTVRTPFIPKVNNASRGYVKGELTYKVREIIFNPGSRDHIADRLTDKYGWKPTEFTETGKPKVDEDVLKHLDYPEAELLTESMMIAKRLGQLSEGKNAWLKLVTPEGKIHHEVSTNGAVTGRCTHKRPNVAQTPSASAPYGKECRMLWGPPRGMKQVGADLSGLELRCLGHFMALYDDGAYIRVILDGDIHTFNSAALFGYDEEVFAAGRKDEDTLLLDVANDHPESGRFLRNLNPGQRKRKTVADYFDFLRNNAKTFIYGFLYGAGAEKIGQIVEQGSAAGKKLMAAFLEKTPALKKLRQRIDKVCSPYIYEETKYIKDGKVKTGRRRVSNPNYRGYLKGLDGRILPIRSAHAALNTLLQSAGALISKKATVLLYERLVSEGYVFGEDWALMAHIHDEVQNVGQAGDR